MKTKTKTGVGVDELKSEIQKQQRLGYNGRHFAVKTYRSSGKFCLKKPRVLESKIESEDYQDSKLF